MFEKKNKQAEGKEMVFLVMIVFLGFLATLLVSSYLFYSKGKINQILVEAKRDVMTKMVDNLTKKADKPGCKFVEVDFSRDSKKTDMQICSEFGKSPQLKIFYKERKIFKGEAGSLSNTDWCSNERLVYSGEESYISTTNLGSEIGEPIDSGCTVINREAGLAEIEKNTALGIICC